MAYATLPTYDELYKKNLESFKAAQDEKIAESNKIYAGQTDYAKKLYNTQINAAESSYGAAIDKNEIQKLINEKQIAESMANMGLTNSGLNRTQTTAIGLSAANNRNAINLQRQQALDNLKLELNGTLTDIENQRASAEMSIKSGYESQAATAATSQYNTLIEQQAAAQESAAEPEYYTFVKTTGNGANIVYRNSKTGQEVTAAPYINPYNGQDARIQYAAEHKDKSIGFFNLSNGVAGHQPRGLVSEGGKFTAETVDGSYVTYYFNGQYQKIWKSPKGNYFIWNGPENRYELISADSVNALKAALM